MAWATPKIDWDADDVLVQTDMNRIEEDVRILGQGNGRASLAVITSAANLDINDTDECFSISGTAEIKFIKIGTRLPGNKIQLYFTGASVNLHHDETTPPPGYAAMWLTHIDYSVHDHLAANAITKFIEFVYDGTYWRSGFLPTA